MSVAKGAKIPVLVRALLSSVLIAMTANISSASEAVAVGSIAVNPKNGSYDITATVEGRSATQVDVAAQLVIIKSDTSGSVQTRQSRRIQVEEGDHEQVARTSVSMDVKGTLEITLTITNKEDVIDTVTHIVSRNQAE